MSEGDNGTICTDFLEINKTEQRLVQIFFFFWKLFYSGNKCRKTRTKLIQFSRKLRFSASTFIKRKTLNAVLLKFPALKLVKD